MTGTAMTEAPEFSEIYHLDVIEIPTNVTVKRDDQHDQVFRTAKEKYKAITELIEECRKRQQPVLVGTVSIEKSELLSEILKKKNIPHAVLNARYHEQEAFIIADAGVPGAVVIATNMAGRGTDIQLGGNLQMRIEREMSAITDEAEREKKLAEIKADIAAKKEVALAAGGLFVIGTERHESRRIDNQLRGRSGRQGDPGASLFFLSLEDDLMRIFGSERMDSMLKRLGLEEGEAIIHPWINKALEKAQQKVEARNFDIRKNLLKFDNVMNDQRKVVYEQRRDLMQAEDLKEEVASMRHEVIDDLMIRYVPEKAFAEQWDIAGLHEEVMRIFNLNLPIGDWAKEEGIGSEDMHDRLVDAVDRKMAEKAANFGPDVLRMAEKSLLLQILDQSWKEHLLALDHLRQGIGLRAYGQRDPLNEYKREAFEMFQAMLARLREQITLVLSHIEIRTQEEIQQAEPAPEVTMPPAPVANALDPHDPSTWSKLNRNADCPCGSGKKYKHCHGRLS
jgi:preprotein translocase subunit SecA